eukprot:scpid60827/ scgid5665/ Zinc finger BED domain-containing protein 4
MVSRCRILYLVLEQAPSQQFSPFQRQSRSTVWKFFTRDVANKKAKCNLCQVKLTYDGCSTSSLQRHLKNRHPSDIDSPSTSTTAASAQPSILNFTNADKIRPTSLPRSREITKILSRWTWLDGRPLSFVKDKGLKELLQLVEPGYSLPSDTHIACLVRKDHEDGLKILRKRLEAADFIALTTDIWTSKATHAYATTTGHFIDSDWKMVACTLETTAFPGEGETHNIFYW